MEPMDNLFGKTLSELEELVLKQGWPRFTAEQIALWLYKKNQTGFDKMTNLSRGIRQTLADNFTCLSPLPESVSIAQDGTRKYLFRFYDRLIETAVIPDRDRVTLCLSTQSGCRMGCRFCATGEQGFSGSLTSGEILSQLIGIEESDRITHIVVMGMGEPLDNLEALLPAVEILTSPWGFGMGAGRITLSTIGIPDALIRVLEQTRINIAVSLHNPFPEERMQIVPAERKWPIAETLKLLKTHPSARERKITMEYILLKDLNDSPRHAAELNRILNGLKTRINLIPWNPAPNSPFARPENDAVLRFQEILKKKGLTVTIRKSRGGEINAACGLLSTTHREKESSGDT